MARLRIEFAATSTVVSLKGAEVTVGRSNRCSVRLPDKSLAGIHFRIRKKERGYRLKDDGSGTGTRVNGKPVFATTLRHGDVIEAGRVRCVFLEDSRRKVPVARPVEEPPPPPSRRRPQQANPARLAAVGAAAVLALGLVAFLLLRTPAEELAQAPWQRALAALQASGDYPMQARERFAEAEAALLEIRDRYGGTNIARPAALRLNEVRRYRKAFARLDLERARLKQGLDEAAELEFRGRLGAIKRTGHPALVIAVERVEQDLEEQVKRRLRDRLADAEKRSRRHLVEERYAAALKVWTDLQLSDYQANRRIRRERERVARRIDKEYRARLKLAGRGGNLKARVRLLEATRPLFSGTRHAPDLEVRISALRARLNRRHVVVLDHPEQKRPRKTGTGPGPAGTPVEAGPYEDPPKVARLVRQRRFGEAASTLQAISRHPDAPVRIEELTLQAKLMADLVAAISAGPAKFTQVLLPDKAGRADVVGADLRFLKVEQAEYPWEALPASSFPRLVRQAGFEKPPRLSVAVFFDEAGLEKEANRAYAAFFRSEQAPTTLTRILARRRGIAAPKEGFLLFRGRLVTRSRKAAVELDERIAKLAKQAVASSDRRRKAAWAELEQLGEPALPALVSAVVARRQAAAGELKAHRAFTPQRFVAKQGKELQRRRKQALAFILDPSAYPYPNKSPSAQKEAERRVDAVRELFEKPFGPLLKASEAAQALDRELADLDGYLARLDPLVEPIRDLVAEQIEKRLNMREVALDEGDRKRIEYNLAVEKYNKGIETSADAEERANVTAVNDYRWMMGLFAVKIDERLVRAARKHSIEMQQENYFAHDSATPQLRSPTMRARREGYPGGAAENIARGPGSGVDAFWAWFRSSGHHRNMLTPRHTELGCGAARHHWWTQNFGRATGRSLTPPRVPPDPDPPGESGNGKPAPG